MHFDIHYMMMGMPQTESWDMVLPYVVPPWNWYKWEALPHIHQANLEVTPAVEQFDLDIHGETIGAGHYSALAINRAMVWGVPTPYTVTVWDFLTARFTAAECYFTL